MLLRRLVPAALVLGLVLAACSEDNPTAPEGYSLDGSWYPIQHARTADGTNYEIYQPPQNVLGIMRIQNSQYNREIGSALVFLRSDGELTYWRDSGQLLFDNEFGMLELQPAGKDSTAFERGEFDYEHERIVVRYTHGDYLYSETWKRVAPIDSIATQTAATGQ